MDWLHYRSSIKIITQHIKYHHKHRIQRKPPPVWVWHYITFAVQIKSLEKSTMPTGTNRVGQDSYLQPHNVKLLLLLPFSDVSCQILSDTKNPTDPNPSFGGSFCFSAAVIAHLSLFSRSYLCWCLQPQTSDASISRAKMFTMQLTESGLSSLGLQLRKICCCACHFQGI